MTRTVLFAAATSMFATGLLYSNPAMAARAEPDLDRIPHALPDEPPEIGPDLDLSPDLDLGPEFDLDRPPAGPGFQQQLRDRLDGVDGADDTAPDIGRDPDTLPEPVRSTRAALIAAASTGDVEALRVVIEAQAIEPEFGNVPGEDPVAYMRAVAGDDAGRETLAIMIEILEAGYAHLDPGEDTELFLWPYVAAVPFADMTPGQEVDLYKIITPFDRESMELYGRYTYYRLGIGPDGSWHFFVAGE
ncbi:MAG: hypothetical protein AAFX39_09005 [Pseudomonadota bacterium]